MLVATAAFFFRPLCVGFSCDGWRRAALDSVREVFTDLCKSVKWAVVNPVIPWVVVLQMGSCQIRSSVSQSVGRPVGQSVSQSVSQADRQAGSQRVSQSVGLVTAGGELLSTPSGRQIRLAVPQIPCLTVQRASARPRAQNCKLRSEKNQVFQRLDMSKHTESTGMSDT